MSEKESIEERYHRAARLLKGMWTREIALNATIFPVWVGESDCFWYERETKVGKEYRLVSAGERSNELAFDHVALARALKESAGVEQLVDPEDLPISGVTMGLSPLQISFSAFGKRWRYDAASESCEAIEMPVADRAVSPDGRYAVFVRDHNLWVVEAGEERPLTRDGEEFYVYGAAGMAWGAPVDSGLQVAWSPDSKRILTVQRDTRQVKSLPIVHHIPPDGSTRPTVEHVKVAYPGDAHIEEYRIVAIDVESGTVREAHYGRVPVSRNSPGFFHARLGWWATDSRRAYFVDQARGDRAVRVVEFNTDTGSTRVLFEETSETQIALMLHGDELPQFVPLPDSNELLWYSERSGWAHLYLYDLDTGALKGPVTEGDWVVRDVLWVDRKRREVFVQTAGRAAGRNPYYQDLCRVSLENGALTTLASSDHEYISVTQTSMSTMFAKGICGRDVGRSFGISPTGNFAVVTRSRADEVPVSLLVDRDGNPVLELEAADVSALPEGWQWPEPVKLLAADGKTDIYGLVFRPSDFSPEQSYPVVSHPYNSPDLAWAARGSFANDGTYGMNYFDATALAELGFIVVQIDGRGSPFRSKAFTDDSYGWLEDAGRLEDHVAGIRQLAERYPYMDLQRVGITTHSQGGPGGVQGLLHHPDFYKVGVQGYLHDSRLMAANMWGDKFEGVSGPHPDRQYPEALVERLRGKLLLFQAMLDFCCPPATVFRLVEALQRANKDVDLVIEPKQTHMVTSYWVRRAWDHLVRHLLGVEPPKEYLLTTVLDQEFSQAEFADRMSA